jgi:peptidoglycan/xylan/chitin deacetylase (PgdA/CDA1 family)
MNIVILVSILIAVIAVFLELQYNLFTLPPKGLRVLMYHKIEDGTPDGLTVTSDQFRQHLAYLRNKGYSSLSFAGLKQIIARGIPLPRNVVILTFDDAYRNFLTKAFPLLKEYGFTATVLVPVAFIGKTNVWDQGTDPLMTGEELRRIAVQENIEIGLHSFLHHNYRDMTQEEAAEDIRNCRKTLSFYAIPHGGVLAYPYGGYPKKDPEKKRQLFELFAEMKLDFALRIGNRINRWPIKQPYEIQRIDIKGSDRFFIFKTKLLKGRAHLFT